MTEKITFLLNRSTNFDLSLILRIRNTILKIYKTIMIKLPVFSYVGCGKNQPTKQTNPNKKNN